MSSPKCPMPSELKKKLIDKAFKKFGSWTLVAASYNMGMFGLEKNLNRKLSVEKNKSEPKIFGLEKQI